MPFPLRRILDPNIEPVSLSDAKNHLKVDFDDDDDLISGIISVSRERAEDLTGCCLLSQQWIMAMDKFPNWWGSDSGAIFFSEIRHPRHRSMFREDNLSIILPRGPVLSVDSITWRDTSGKVNTLDPSLYEVDLLSVPARMRPVYNGTWPHAAFDTNAVQITFTCGYQQTVTELLTLTPATPFTCIPTRAATAVSLTSVIDASTLGSQTPTVLTAVMANGIITVSNGTADQSVQVIYQTQNIPKSFIHAMKLMISAWYDNRAEVVQGGGNFNSMPTPMGASSLLSTYELFHFGYPK